MAFNAEPGLAIILTLSLLLLAFGTIVPSHAALAASAITINASSKHQTIDGFGFSDAFGPASTLQTSPASQQKQMLDLLFNT